jgi:hypothetical protein
VKESVSWRKRNPLQQEKEQLMQRRDGLEVELEYRALKGDFNPLQQEQEQLMQRGDELEVQLEYRALKGDFNPLQQEKEQRSQERR